MNKTVNDQLQLIDEDWEITYTPILSRCRNTLEPLTMITVPGEGRTYDYIQLCRDFFEKYIGDSMDMNRPYSLNPMEGRNLTQNEIVNG